MMETLICSEKVKAAAFTGDNFGKWAGSRNCKGKVVVSTSAGKHYCKRHAHRAAEYEAALNYGKKEEK
jgi:hypothetical protein